LDDVNPSPRGWDLTRIVLGVMTIGGLTMASFWVLRPFLLAGIWAVMIVVATWPTLRAIQARLWGKRSLAVAAMTLIMIVIIVAPLTTAVVGIADRTDDILAWSRTLVGLSVPPPPEWVSQIPLVGRKIAKEWAVIASTSSEDLFARAAPYLRDIAPWVLGQLGAIGTLMVHLLLAVSISAILYANGEKVAAGVLAFARRLAGQAGERVTVLAASAIRAVALGIVLTALVQSVIGGIGLVITGVPYPLLLTSVMFLLGVAQIGPLPVLLGAVAWIYWSSGTFWGTVLLLWSVGTGSLDNILRPILIKRGADLPLLLIFAGVLGGLLAFGLVGLFVGPVVLAVTYTLLEAWVTGPGAPKSGAGREV
jgi:predicted PurR-regulated permease PerM